LAQPFLKVEVLAQPFLKVDVLAQPFLKVEVLAQPFLKVEKVDYHDPNAPPPNTELAAIGSINPSDIPGVAAPGMGVLSC